MIAYCLVDLFNLALWPLGRSPQHADVAHGIDELVSAVLRASPSAREVTIRLYGGWHGDVPENRVTLRDLTAQVASRYPGRVGATRVRIELAESPVWDRSVTLLRTVQVWFVDRLATKIERPARSCSQPSSCCLEQLDSWRKGRCPEPTCSVSLRDVATTTNQKMVDTLLTADALAIASDGLADLVLIASDDEDMIPALLALTRTNVSVILMSRRSGLPQYYAGILELQGLTTHIW